MIEYRIADGNDIELLMRSRLKMLREVNNLDEDYRFTDEFIRESRDYFLGGGHTSVLAMEGGKVMGCASICYVRIMPTFSHPTGKRAHLMNVFTEKDYRRRGIAKVMVSKLIEEAWRRGVTEISLDTTEPGRPFYESLGFVRSNECMVHVRA